MPGTVTQRKASADAIAERLRDIIFQVGSIAEVAKRSGVKDRTLRTYLEGREMKASTLVALARACGVSVEYLATGTEHKSPGEAATYTLVQEGVATIEGAMHRVGPYISTDPSDIVDEDEEDHTPFVRIPRYDVQAAAGAGAEVTDERVTGHIAFDRDFLRHSLHCRPEDLVFITASGDSMEPTIRDGDLLLVDTSNQEFVGNHVLILNVSGLLVVKRIEMGQTGHIVIRSDNSDYKDEHVVFSPGATIRVVGQVVYHAGPIH